LGWPLKTNYCHQLGNRDQVYPEIVSANQCLGGSPCLLRNGINDIST
jgi:hypothetical protein